MQLAQAGAEYAASISRRRSDVRTRAAFQALALQLAPAGALIFDFGAGPGIDARFFAQRGYRVHAYEIDPRMQSYFREYCTDELASGRIRLDVTEYHRFVDQARSDHPPEVDLVVADFAPLNLVDDLTGLFRRLHALSRANGRILASVLSPYFVGDWRYGWWWRGLPDLRRVGRMAVAGSQATITRRTPQSFAEAATPYFRVAGIWPGRSSLADRPVRASHPSLAVHRYLFLLFEKCA